MLKTSNIKLNMLLKYTLVSFSIVSTSVAMSHAQGLQTLIESTNTFSRFLAALSSGVVVYLGIIMMGIAVVVFFAGMVRFIWANKKGEAGKLEEGRRFMLWGVIALFVMVSIWGIVGFLQDTVGIRTQTGGIVLPGMNFGSGGTTGAGGTPAQSGTQNNGGGLPGSGARSSVPTDGSCSRGAGYVCSIRTSSGNTVDGICTVSPEDGLSVYCNTNNTDFTP